MIKVKFIALVLFFTFGVILISAQNYDLNMLKKAEEYIRELPQNPPDKDGLVAVPYFVWGDYKRGNELIEKVDVGSKGEWGYWNLYEIMTCWMLFKKHLTPAAAKRIEFAFKGAMKGRLKDHPYYHAEGNCVNHPLSKIMLLMLGGEQFGDEGAAAKAYKGFYSFAKAWSKMGSYREYNSPTYQAVDMMALAMVKQFSKNAEIVTMAKILEERLWVETAARYHKSTWTLAGPYSRAYKWDILGGATDSQYYYHRVLGKDVPLILDCTKSLYRMDHRLSWLGRSSVIEYSCPDYIKDRMIRPLKELQYTSSVAGHKINQNSYLTTYLKGNYSLGTNSDRCPRGGQREDFVSRWLIQGTADKVGNFRSGIIRNHSRAKPTPFILQNKGHVIAAYSNPLNEMRKGPIKFFYAAAEFNNEIKFEEIRIGQKKVSLPFRERITDPILIKDGNIYCAFLPLQPIGGGAVLTEISERTYKPGEKGKFDTVSIRVNAIENGSALKFSEKEIAQTFTGFCIQVVNASDYESFDSFCKEVSSWKQLSETDGSNVTVTWDTGSKVMKNTFNIVEKRIVRQSINNKLQLMTPMISGTLTKMDTTGVLELNKCILQTKENVPSLLYADSEMKSWMAMVPDDSSVPVKLITPAGTLTIPEAVFFKAEILGRRKEVRINALKIRGPLTFSGKEWVLYVNGKKWHQKGNTYGVPK